MAKILVADDAPAILDALHDVLTAAGHQVIKAASGAEALRKFQDSRPQLAVIDIMMPDIDGLVVLDAIRKLTGMSLSFSSRESWGTRSRGSSSTTARCPSSRRARASTGSSNWSTKRLASPARPGHNIPLFSQSSRAPPRVDGGGTGWLT